MVKNLLFTSSSLFDDKSIGLDGLPDEGRPARYGMAYASTVTELPTTEGSPSEAKD